MAKSDIMTNFGEERKKAIALILKDLRERKGLTQKELAEKLYVTYSTISHYEQGTSTPTTDMIIKLSEFYDVSTDYLLNNCVDRVNYSKQLNKKLDRDMTIGRAVAIILNASAEQRKIISGILKLVENQSKK